MAHNYCNVDLQNVDITLRLLFRPRSERLPNIYQTIGVDYDERVLPSITTEVLKAVVVSTCAVGLTIMVVKGIVPYKRHSKCRF